MLVGNEYLSVLIEYGPAIVKYSLVESRKGYKCCCIEWPGWPDCPTVAELT